MALPGRDRHLTLHKSRYENFGPENNVYAIVHVGKYGGGHPATYFDTHHDFRNAIDCGTGDGGDWNANDMNLITYHA